MAEFLGSNDLGSRQMLRERSIYRSYVLSLLNKVQGPVLETRQIKDFAQDERLLIGRVDARYNPVYPSDNFMKPIYGGGASGNTQLVYALDFVADAFEAMKEKFDKDFRANKINPDAPVLSQLNVKLGYSSPLQQYDFYLSDLISDFLSFVKKRNRINKIRDFGTFLPVFMNYVKLRTRTAPITRSMYLLTKFVHPRASGLVLELWDGAYAKDRDKVDLFYRQQSFEYFKNLAHQYGFMIDKNIPWRLVADLNSPRLRPFIENNYGVGANAGTILFTVFNKTYVDDIPIMVQLMVDMYNAVANFRPRSTIKEPVATGTEYSGRTIFNSCGTSRVIERTTTTVAEVEEKYGNDTWLPTYTRIRNLETSLNYEENVLSQIIKNAIDLSKSVDNASALNYIVSKFDNVEHFEGSLFYDITRIKLAKEAGATESDVKELVQRSVQASNFVVY